MRKEINKALELFFVACLAFAASAAVAGRCGVTTDAPGWTFVETERPSFVLTNRAEGVGWTLCDWRGRMQASGVWPEDGKLVLNALPPGYYKVCSDNAAGDAPRPFTFCVTRKDPCRDPDSFFATDAAFTSISRRGVYDCPWYGGDSLRVTAELLGKCGLTHTRERNWWPQMEPKQGQYAFDAYLASAKLLAENGVKAFGLVHSTPSWTRRPGKELPGDLAATYRFMAAAAKAFEPYYDAWEFWNEPDLRSTSEPVWEYAAALKAAALGARAGSETTVVLPGSLSCIDSAGFARTMFGNDLPKYVQALNIHTYHAPKDLARWSALNRSFLADCGIPDWQVWLTESGTDLESHGRLPSVCKGLMAHDAEQEMIVAEFAVKDAVLQRFHGTFRNWFFLFGVYNERHGEKDWGSMRRDGSVKPVHAALSAITGELGSADQLGSVDLGKDVGAYLYQRKDGRKTLVVWSASAVDKQAGIVLGKTSLGARTIELPVGEGTFDLVDMMGTPSKVESADGKVRLAIDRYPQYLTGPLRLPVATAARPTGKSARYVPQADEDLTVVIRPEVDTNDFSVTAKSLAELNRERGRIRMEVWNLSDRTKRGSLAFSCGTAKGAPDAVELPAWGKAVVEVEWTPPVTKDIVFNLDVSGTFDGKRVSRSRLPVTCPYVFLRQCKVVPFERLNRPESWSRNDSAATYACRWDEQEQAVRFDVSWKSGVGRWFYPVCDLKLPEESLDGARYLEFEVKTAQDKVENDFTCQYVMMVGSPKNLWLDYKAPSFGWERRRVLLPADAGLAKAMRIGANPNGTRLTYWIRNVRILK